MTRSSSGVQASFSRSRRCLVRCFEGFPRNRTDVWKEDNLFQIDLLYPKPSTLYPVVRSTTILAVRHKGRVVVAGDGQVSFGDTVMKQTARKVRRMWNDRVIAGFAGAAADAFALFTEVE